MRHVQDGRRRRRRAVVDGAGRVHGVDGLRVVDASIFPTVPNGNLNAPTIMAAGKVADHVLGRALPPDHAAAAATWVDPEWRTRRRERPPMRRVWDGQFSAYTYTYYLSWTSGAPQNQ